MRTDAGVDEAIQAVHSVESRLVARRRELERELQDVDRELARLRNRVSQFAAEEGRT